MQNSTAMTSNDELRLAVRLVHLDIGALRTAIDDAGLTVKRGTILLLEAQQSVLRQVDRELGAKPVTRRLRALAKSTVGVLPSLFNSVEKSAKGVELGLITQCRLAVDELSDILDM